MTSPLSKFGVFTKILPIKAETFRDLSDLKSRQINGTKRKENFLFNINNSILKKLSITKSDFSAKVRFSNLTLALKL